MSGSSKKSAPNLPKGWRQERLGRIMKFVNGYAFKPEDWEEKGLPIIRIQNLNDESASYNYYSGQVDERYYVRKGDILFAWSGTKGVSFGARKWSKGLAILNQHIFRVLPIKADADFCYYLLKGTQERIERNAHGFKSSFVHVTKGDLEKVTFPLPTLSEQSKIAAALSAWDDSIHIASRLLEAKQLRKRSLMQHLLTGQTRLWGFENLWQEVKLEEIFQRVQRKTRENIGIVLSISAKDGFVSQQEKFSKVIAGKNLAKYTLLKKGEFAYNKGNSGSFPCGCIYELETYDEAAVPNVYYCFKNRGRVDNEFYKHYFSYRLIDRQLTRRINSGVRNDGLLNLNASDFFEVTVHCPPISEQRAIAAVLNAADEEIRLAMEEIEVLQIQKRGLMTQLLTGQILTTV